MAFVSLDCMAIVFLLSDSGASLDRDGKTTELLGLHVGYDLVLFGAISVYKLSSKGDASQSRGPLFI